MNQFQEIENMRVGSVLRCVRGYASGILEAGKLYRVLVRVNEGLDYHGSCSGLIVAACDESGELIGRMNYPYVWDFERFTLCAPGTHPSL